MTPPQTGTEHHRTDALYRIRNLLLTGLLVIAPTAVTVWVLFKLLNFVDNLLGRYLRFAALDYHRVPGLGLVAVLLILLIVGWFASWIGSKQIGALWDQFLTRLPGVGILYGSTKSMGEALFTNRKEPAFRQVVLVQWPHPALYRIGFVTGRPGPEIRERLGSDYESVFVPHTPNPASGFMHYAPRSAIVYLNWTVEDALRVIVSGGVVQPGSDRPIELTTPPGSSQTPPQSAAGQG
jgi:uncharacterized membrane protein